NEALRQEMSSDPNVIILGEDIAETGGIFQVTKGLVVQFGTERVRDTPISEATFCGAGIGAAIAGMRPVVEVQIFDFVTQMMDMIVNQAAKFRFMNGGVAKVPVVIRDDNPAIFLEHKMLYLGPPGPVPEENYAIPLGKADIKRVGTDVTIVA